MPNPPSTPITKTAQILNANHHASKSKDNRSFNAHVHKPITGLSHALQTDPFQGSSMWAVAVVTSAFREK